MRRVFLSLCVVVGIAMAIMYGPSLIGSCKSWWNNEQSVSYFVAWIPLALTIAIAFVPDQQMKWTTRILWRAVVIGLGAFYSILLAHQQTLTATSSLHQQQKIVEEAVKQSNDFTGPKIGAVQQDVQGVKSDIGGVKTDLQKTRDDLAQMLHSSESNITSSVGKIGKPDPAKLQVSFWPTAQDISFPILKRTLAPDTDGSITAEITIKNVFGSSASAVDAWILIGEDCHFAIEPAGFDHPPGMEETERHLVIPNINPQVLAGKLALKIKIDKPFTGTEIQFWYSCQSCSPDGLKHQKLILKEGYNPFN